MIDNGQKVAVKFIGREPWFDHLYKTGLTFEPGQVREMPEVYARKFLRHIDVFVEHKGGKKAPQKADKPTQDEAAQQEAAQDDTAAILENSEAKQAEENEEQESKELYDTLSLVNEMTRDALFEFAEERYQVKLNRRAKVDDLRAEVTGLVNQFGVL